MNDLTIQRQSLSSVSRQPSVSTELAKMLSLVAPITMSADQQTLWLASAVDALDGIRTEEVQAVSAEVRRTVNRPSQIVPEIAKLVAARRSERNRISELARPMIEGPPKLKHVLDRRGEPMSEDDTAQLNAILARENATARYRPDGTRYTVDRAA